MRAVVAALVLALLLAVASLKVGLDKKAKIERQTVVHTELDTAELQKRAEQAQQRWRELQDSIARQRTRS